MLDHHSARTVLVGALVVMTALCGYGSSAAMAEEPLKLTPTAGVRFATADEGSKILSTRDAFVAAMSPFDRSVRLKTAAEVSEREFLARLGRQATGWKDVERELLTQVVQSAAKRLARWKLPLPTEITLVCMLGDEEGGAPHCRGPAIVLPRAKLALPAETLERIFLHETFHVLSSANPDLRDELYAIVGFRRCGKVALPPDLLLRKITNPDAPTAEHAIELDVDGKSILAVPVLFSKTDYDDKKGGGLFDYLSFRLLAVHTVEGKTTWLPDAEGKPWLLDPAHQPSYHKQIGTNTRYIIHPEEVLADNFQMLVSEAKAKEPRILEAIDKVLSKSRE